MKIFISAVIFISVFLAHAASIDSVSYNPRDVSVNIPSAKNEIKIHGDWFDIPISNVGEKLIAGDSPISVYNNASYYLKIGNRKKFSLFYPPEMRKKVLIYGAKLKEHQIKGYISSGKYCFIIFTNGSFFPLKLSAGKWIISTNDFPHGEIVKYYPILEFLKNSTPPEMRHDIKVTIGEKTEQKLPDLYKKIIDEFRSSQKREKGVRSYYLAYIWHAGEEMPHSEFIKLTNPMNGPKISVRMTKQDNSTFGAYIKCDFGKISYNSSIPVPDKDGIEIILANSNCCSDNNKSEKLFIILFSL